MGGELIQGQQDFALQNTLSLRQKREPVRFGAIGRWLLNNHLDTIRARRDFNRQVQEHPVLKGAEALLATGLESIPWVGDGLTALEALRGKTIDGMPLSVVERALYVFFSIPSPPMPIDLPARPAVALYHELDQHVLTPILLGILGPEAQQEDQQAQAALYMPRRGSVLGPSHEPLMAA